MHPINKQSKSASALAGLVSVQSRQQQQQKQNSKQDVKMKSLERERESHGTERKDSTYKTKDLNPRNTSDRTSSMAGRHFERKASEDHIKQPIKKSKSATKKHLDAKKPAKTDHETDTKSGKSTNDEMKSKSAKKQQIKPEKGKKSLQQSKLKFDGAQMQEESKAQTNVKKKKLQRKKSFSKPSNEQDKPIQLLSLAEEILKMFRSKTTPVSLEEEHILSQKFTKEFIKKTEEKPFNCQACFQRPKLPVAKKDKEQLEYLQWLYQFAFCKKCHIACHVLCVGMPQHYTFQTMTHDEQHQLIFFECDKCIQGKQSSPACTVCDQKEGFLKKIEKGMYVHSICALAFPGSFPLLDPNTMSFGYSQPSDSQMEEGVCEICTNSKNQFLVDCNFKHPVLLKSCKNKCKNKVHPFCAVNKKTTPWSYQFVTEILDEANILQEACSKTLERKNLHAETILRWLCFDHLRERSIVCFQCEQENDYTVNGTMVQCDFCEVWFHDICIKHKIWLESGTANPQKNLREECKLANDIELKFGDQTKCKKCTYWYGFFRSPQLRVLVGLDTQIELKLNSDGWRDNWMPPRLFQFVSSSTLEQIFICKLWTSLSTRLAEVKCTQNMIDKQIEQKNLFFFNCSSFETPLQIQMEQNDKQKPSQFKELQKCQVKEIIEYTSVVDSENKNSFNQLVENDKANQELVAKLEQMIADNNMSNFQILQGDLLEINLLIRKVQTLNTAKQLIFQKELIKKNKLDDVLRDFCELDFKENNSYKILLIMQKLHVGWQRDIQSVCEMNAEISDDYRYVIKKMREKYRGLELATKRYDYLTEIFKNRGTVSELRNVLQRDTSNLATDMSSYKKIYQDKVDQIDNYFRRAQSYISKAADKPLQRMLELFVQMASQPVKPDKIDELLKIWLQSAEWNAFAKSFVTDKLKPKEKAKSSSSKSKKESDITELPHHFQLGDNLLLGLREPQLDESQLKNKFIFTKEQIQEMIDRTKVKYPNLELQQNNAKKQPIVYDKRLFDLVVEKFELIKNIQASEEEIRSQTHNTDDLKTYIQTCQSIENFDLSKEIENAKTKLEVIQLCLVLSKVNHEGSSQLESTDEEKNQSLIQLSNKVQELKNRRDDPIFIPQMLEMMLEAKVQISEQLKREFQETLQSGADSFNKQMIIDLRKIVSKATKEHGLSMDKERKIVENLGRSEEWFVETFAQLKKICGQALHQIDFKDYQQLHQILKSARDCDYLLKSKDWKPAIMENLVGAARNLYLSLQGAKWLFEVKTLLDKTNGIKELAQLLSLYYRAKELNIDLSIVEQPELIEEGDFTTINLPVLSEFVKLSKVAVDFDNLFGTHQKVIETLERYEKKKSMQELVEKVDSLSEQLQFQSAQSNPEIKLEPSKGCAISTNAEQEILQKVRSYINLNQDYQNFILKQEVPFESVKDEQQVSEDDSKLFVEDKEDMQFHKISYHKALRLQRQARASQIPDDIPVLKRLNQSVLRFDKFKKKCSDYYKFRERIKQKGASLLSQALIQSTIKGQTQKVDKAQAQKNPDQEFSLSFVQDLLEESASLDIEIPNEIFAKDQILVDLEVFQKWRNKAENVLADLDRELKPSNFRHKVQEMEVDLEFTPSPKPSLVDEAVIQDFNVVKEDIKDLPIYESDLFLKIQAFEWLLNAKNLVEGGAQSDGKFISSLPYWETMLKQHEQFLKSLPMLRDHPILQKIIWEIERARQIVEFVSKQKQIIKSNQGKFLNDRYQNYVAFRTKHSSQKIENLLVLAQKTKVDISEEIQLLNDWLHAFYKYSEMVKNKTLYEQNKYEQIKLIQKHIYLSPIEYDDLYFTISKRLEIAQQIRQDLKNIIEEQTFQNQKQGKKSRIKYSRVSFDLNHFEKNCQIPGIQEVEKIQFQIKNSRQKIAEALQLLKKCADVSPEERIKIRDQARKIAITIEIDMEEEEQPLIDAGFKISFGLMAQGHQKLDLEQIKQLDKDFKKVQDSLEESDPDIVAQYTQIKQDVIKCLRLIKKLTTKAEFETTVKDEIEQLCPNVNFDQQVTDKLAEIYLKEKSSGAKEIKQRAGGTISVAEFEEQRRQAKKQDTESASESESSESSSESESSESSEEVIVFKKGSDGKIIKISSKEEKSSSSSYSDSSSVASSDSSNSEENEEAENEANSSEAEEAESEMEEIEEEQEENLPESLIAGRKRRQIKANKMDDHIYFDDARKQREQEKLQSKFESLTEEQKQFFDEQLKKREQKKKEKAAAKLAAKEFEAQQHRQQKLKDQRKAEDENPDEHLGLNKDQTLVQSILNIRERTRKQSQDQVVAAIKRLDDHLLSQPHKFAIFEPTLAVSKQEMMTQFMKIVESVLAEKYPMIDANYKRKINDICVNIKQIHSYPELAEVFFLKKSLNCFAEKGKPLEKSQTKQLLQSHLFFKDHLAILQAARDEKKPKFKILAGENKQKVLFDQSKHMEKKDLFNDQTAQSMDQRRRDYTSGESSGESGGAINTSARFSDDEEPAQQSTSLAQLASKNASAPNTQFEDNKMFVPHQMYKYNPFLVVSLQSRAQTAAKDQRSVQLPLHLQQQLNEQAPQSEPILYDPIKQGQTTTNLNVSLKNIARPGSLLKVWEGSLQSGACESTFNVQFFSIGDIRSFQNLPDLPNTFSLKGKSKLHEVMSHFLKLRQEMQLAKLKKTHPPSHFLLKGWVTRKNNLNQSNSDLYASHFDSLEQTQRCSVFTLFKGLNIYLVPVIAETKLFCKQMGVVPLKPQQNSGKSFEEETLYFAFFVHLKSTFNKKLSFLNPTVVCHLEDIHRVSKSENQSKLAVPNVNLIQPALPVKNELDERKQHYEPEDDDERELDALIARFRAQGVTNIEEIQQKLLPIIEKFSGTGRKEEKLEAFLKEVIEKINAQQPAQRPYTQPPQFAAQYAGQQQFYQQQPYMQQYNQGFVPPYFNQQPPFGQYYPPGSEQYQQMMYNQQYYNQRQPPK